MYTDTEAVVLKQYKIANGRRMILLFTKKFGKISAGTSIAEGGKGKSALVLRPFTQGRYALRKRGDTYHINGGEVISSHYRISETVERYACASYVMEFTEKILPEEAPSISLYLLLTDFFRMIEKRTSSHETLVVAFLIKALKIYGSEPQVDCCIDCGSKENLFFFSIRDGGVVCETCYATIDRKDRLLYEVKFDIVNIIRFLTEHPLSSVEGLALDEDRLSKIRQLLREYYAYHLDIRELKSEELMEPR